MLLTPLNGVISGTRSRHCWCSQPTINLINIDVLADAKTRGRSVDHLGVRSYAAFRPVRSDPARPDEKSSCLFLKLDVLVDAKTRGR